MELLFVDDDEAWADLFKDAVDDWNDRTPERQFRLTVLADPGRAADALGSGRFDCVLLDLQLPDAEDPGHQLSGNDLALATFREIGMPMAILSGFPEDRAVELREEPLVRAFRKQADVCDEVMEWFGGQWEMMDALAVARSAIHRAGAQIFARRIWPRWQQYRGLSAAGAPLGKIVTRQYATHIAELMGIDGADNPDWHPLESYINPALLDHRAHTGDLFRLDDQIWVVLTPQCDMANANVENVLLAHCDPDLLPDWDEKLARLGQPQPPDKVSRYFRDLVNQKVDPSRHFLAPLEDRPLMVNFKRLRLEPMAKLNALLNTDRLASVAPPFLSNLTQRFAAYIARPGQPNIGVEHFVAPAV